MSLVGKYVIQEWINPKTENSFPIPTHPYRNCWLRRIDRETSNQAISEVQRYFQDFEKNVDYRTFHSNWAIRFWKHGYHQ